MVLVYKLKTGPKPPRESSLKWVKYQDVWPRLVLRYASCRSLEGGREGRSVRAVEIKIEEGEGRLGGEDMNK